MGTQTMAEETETFELPLADLLEIAAGGGNGAELLRAT